MNMEEAMQIADKLLKEDAVQSFHSHGNITRICLLISKMKPEDMTEERGMGLCFSAACLGVKKGYAAFTYVDIPDKDLRNVTGTVYMVKPDLISELQSLLHFISGRVK